MHSSCLCKDFVDDDCVFPEDTRLNNSAEADEIKK